MSCTRTSRNTSVFTIIISGVIIIIVIVIFILFIYYYYYETHISGYISPGCAVLWRIPKRSHDWFKPVITSKFQGCGLHMEFGYEGWTIIYYNA